MKTFINKIAVFSIALLFFACESSEDEIVASWIDANEIEPDEPGTPGSLSLSNYVAIGNSLTAGFADGALYTEGQDNSFPNLLAGQFQLVGGGDFNQPDINSENGFNSTFSDLANGVIAGKTVLDLSDQAPVPTVGELPGVFSGDRSMLNNFGVPGIVTAQLLTPATGGPDPGADPSLNPAYNALYARFASSPSADGMTGSTIIGDAVATDPSFFSLWIGSNDILAYAATGGAATSRPITSTVEFTAQYQLVIDQLKGDPGVVLTIPPILLTPFFRAVSWDAVELDEATAGAVNSGLASINDLLDGSVQAGYMGDVSARKINYVAGDNPILIWDEDLDDLTPFFRGVIESLVRMDETIMQLPDGPQKEAAVAAAVDEQFASAAPYVKARPLTSSELVLLSAGAVLGNEADGDDTEADTPIGLVIPLGYNLADPSSSSSDAFILDAAEQAEINSAVEDLNVAIGTIVATENATGSDILLVDVIPTFLDLFGVTDGELGIDIEGVLLSPDFAPNGVFSSDAIHANARGNAIIANLIIDGMNARWGSSIDNVDVLTLKGVPFQP